MKFQEILKEFDTTIHFRKRLNQRFINPPALDVIALSNDEYHRKIIIGSFVIPEEAKLKILKIIKKLEDPDYTGIIGTQLVIELYDFNITPDIVKLNNPKYLAFFKDKRNWRVILQEPPIPGNNEPLTNGNYLVCIVNGNNITTVFLTRTKEIAYIKNKRQKDFNTKEFISIKDVDTELDAYLDVDSLKQHNTKTNYPSPEKPQEPELIDDKEKRLRAYKERMKKLYGGKGFT